MSRYALPSATPGQPTYEGDTQFLAINEKLSPDQLKPGEVHRAVNKRLRTGQGATRPGTVRPAFANNVSFSEILGSGLYSNPNGLEVILIATPHAVYQIADGTCAGEIAIPADQALDTPCEFVQAFDKVLLFRGIDRTPLEWDGLSAAGFTVIAMSTPDDPTKHLIPNAVTGEVFQNRLLVPINRDDVDVSDILDYTQFDPLLENWRINMGTADGIVRIFPYANSQVEIFKERSILELANFTDPDHPEAATLRKINDAIGLASRRAVVYDGTDVQFMADTHGVYRLTQVIQDRTQSSPVSVSDPIQPTIDRINWIAKETICGAMLGEYIFWAVPLDGSAVANAILVFNNATSRWESVDEWTGDIDLSNLIVMNYHGKQALYAIDNTSRSVYVLYIGKTDQLADGEYEIRDLLETRGYATLGWNAAMFRNQKQLKVSLRTWRPAVTITQLTDRASDERVITRNAITRDTLKFDVWGKRDFVPDNSNDDADAPGRQDYSADFTDGMYLGSGVDLEKKQSLPLEFSVQAQSRWVSYRIENTQGACDVEGVLVESAGAQRVPRRAA
jgi:hypothetical protein